MIELLNYAFRPQNSWVQTAQPSNHVQTNNNNNCLQMATLQPVYTTDYQLKIYHSHLAYSPGGAINH